MESATISSKHTIVIPKNIRKKLGTQPGQKVYFKMVNKNTVKVTSESQVEKAFGSFPDLFGDNPDKELRKMRDEANRRRA